MRQSTREAVPTTPFPSQIHPDIQTLPPTVAAIGAIPFTGNLIPPSWYKRLKLPSGRTDLVGCIVLAEIVYQYRPRAVTENITGKVLHYVKRFARDRFCAPLAYFAKKFELTTDQVRQALKRLEQAGLIHRDYRAISVAGRTVHGMTFVEPVPAAIRTITQPTQEVDCAGDLPGAIRGKARLENRPSGTVSSPESAVSPHSGAVQIPLYKDPLQQIPKFSKTPTAPYSIQAKNETEKGSGSRLSNRCFVIASSYEGDTVQKTGPVSSDTLSATPSTSPLQFDFHLAHLDELEREDFQRRLGRLPLTLAQLVLDEYNSALGRGMMFRNRWGWIEYLIRKAQRGEFIPTSELKMRRMNSSETTASGQRMAIVERISSTVWQLHKDTFKTLLSGGDFGTYILPLRAIEEGERLWLEAPNGYVVDWVTGHWALFEQVLKPHTQLNLGIRLETG
ncbi:MAG: hypothetical protein H6970_09520 [Gammaproteobacteria bacterium]|nr:hypothetical protein [Gammaproteobacteria bacterium]